MEPKNEDWNTVRGTLIDAYIGPGGYQDVMFGIHFELSCSYVEWHDFWSFGHWKPVPLELLFVDPTEWIGKPVDITVNALGRLMYWKFVKKEE